MKKFSGTFTGKANWQNDVALHHRGGHHLNFAEVSGEQYNSYVNNFFTFLRVCMQRSISSLVL